MRRQAYERAVEINDRLNYLEELTWLFSNAAGDHHNLAAVRVPDSYTPETSITNEMELTIDLRDKFIKIIRDEQKQLREEFDNL